MLVLQTPRLNLRWFDARDARFVLALLNDPGWLRHIGNRNVHTKREARQWIAARLLPAYGRLGFGFWAMERRSDGALIGMCGLIQRDNLPEVDVGYALLPRFRGQGLAREGAAACLRYGQEVLGLQTIWAITSPGNRASARVLEAIGMQDDGLRRLVGERRRTRVFTWAAPTPPEDDRLAIDALVGRFLRAFCNRGDDPPTLPALPHYFVPEPVIHQSRSNGPPQRTDLNGFIGPRAQLLMGGRLREFAEWELEHRTEIAGAVAQRWLRYAKSGTLDGQAFTGQGSKLLQLVRGARGWKIAALAWQDDDAAPPAPPMPPLAPG